MNQAKELLQGKIRSMLKYKPIPIYISNRMEGSKITQDTAQSIHPEKPELVEKGS